MNFSGTKSMRLSRKAIALTVAAAALATVAGCGGGTRVGSFNPTAVLAFGDENSVITTDGRKYSINALKADGSVDCLAHPLWIQTVANSYGIVFDRCNPNGVAAPGGRIFAANGAMVADVKGQIDAHLAGGGTFTPAALATFWAGGNDVREIYSRYPAITADAAVAEAEARGAAYAEQINRVANAGGRALVVTILDQGQTPFGKAEQAAKTDTDRSALLTQITRRFNAGLRVGLVNDGRLITLSLADERVQAIQNNLKGFTFTNGTQAACLPGAQPPDCNTKTLRNADDGTPADPLKWLWADDRHLSAGGHQRVGELALGNVNTHPF